MRIDPNPMEPSGPSVEQKAKSPFNDLFRTLNQVDRINPFDPIVGKVLQFFSLLGGVSFVFYIILLGLVSRVVHVVNKIDPKFLRH